jgi:lysophospholipase L1-like esterase
MTTRTLFLLGDSILDNAPYTRPEPDSAAHLRRLLPEWNVVCLARDGAVMDDVGHQLREIGQPAATAVLSIGGNDAIQHVGLLESRASDSAGILDRLLLIADDFEERYQDVARSLAERVDHTVLCTIYEVRLEPAPFARLARVPLAVLNDRIIRTAARLGVDVLELRTVCTEPDDFVLQIEPSARGAARIAEAIAALLLGHSALTSGRVFCA